MSPFEDILDGYFPLRVSVTDLMQRRNLCHAAMDLCFAPIIKVSGLAFDAPVPLNIRSGRAGMIYKAELNVTLTSQGAALSGVAHWTWLDRMPASQCLDPMIRLAEPALIHVTPQQNAPDGARGTIVTRDMAI